MSSIFFGISGRGITYSVRVSERANGSDRPVPVELIASVSLAAPGVKPAALLSLTGAREALPPPSALP